MREPVVVRVRDCECPGTPHAGEEGDTVLLAPRLSLAGGLQATADIVTAAGSGALLAAAWQVTFVRFGAIGWNWLDEDAQPVPFDVNALLDDYTIGLVVAEKADELYGDAVMRPLTARLKNSSPSGRTNGSSSTTPRSTTKPSARSSRRALAATPPSMP